MAEKIQGYISGRHTYLKPEVLKEIEASLLPPETAPTGEVRESSGFSAFQVSKNLSDHLLLQWQKDPLWFQCQPILLGSFGRGELCPKSDLDLLFLGDEAKVLQWVAKMEAQGIRIRYRVPQNRESWDQGVEVADWLALWRAQGLSLDSQKSLLIQQQKIFSKVKYQRIILQVLVKERAERVARFDSISNFLEPNLKYGSGGLRDLFQGLVILDLLKAQFPDIQREKKILEYYLGFFLTLRQKLHFSGFSDTLVSSEQSELAKWFGYKDLHEFMRQIQRGISRVAFYSDWILETARASSKKLEHIENRKLTTAKSLVLALKKDPSVLSQHQVRQNLDSLFGSSEQKSKVSFKMKGQFLGQILAVTAEDKWIQAVFRSRLIDKLCPRIVRLVGYVQHDQYHRFTADAHILQACREAKRLYKNPRSLGPLQKVAQDISASDWKIISWACMYHDLAKGISGSDHSEQGEKWVREDLKKYGLTAQVIKEVEWLVRNHLQLSIAAFRKNPKSSTTWQELQNLGLSEPRLLRLAIFTAIDIRATNPEAWNDWKAKLLGELVETLRSGKTQNFLSVQNILRKTRSPKNVADEVLALLDGQIFEVLSAKALAKDFQASLEEDSGWQVFRDTKKKIWVRYHQKSDRPGLLSDLLDILYSSGCTIQHALIHTLPQIGVYDWFQVQTSREIENLKSLLPKMKPSQKNPAVSFLKVELVSQSSTEWVIGLKGVDQKGLLLKAAMQLKEFGCDICSARVHTWGRQIEDLFHIKPMLMESEDLIQHLKGALIEKK